MLQVGDHVRVKAKTGGPDVSERLAYCRLLLQGQQGVIVDIVSLLDRPVVVAFTDIFVPAKVRFWKEDLREVKV